MGKLPELPDQNDATAVFRFAMTYHGYNEQGSFDNCAARAKEKKRETIDDLRNELFFAARASRHKGDEEYLAVYAELIPFFKKFTSECQDHEPNAGSPHRWLWFLLILLFIYISSFVSLRATGIYYAYFSQGSWELEYTGFDPAEEGSLWGALDEPVFIIFSPLWAADQSLLHLYNEEPTGG